MIVGTSSGRDTSFDHKRCRGCVARRWGDLVSLIEARCHHAEPMTSAAGSGRSMSMVNAGLSRAWALTIWASGLCFFALNCDKGADSQAKPTSSEAAAPTLEVPTAQPPKILEQPVLAPPSLSPPTPSGAEAAATPTNVAAKTTPAAPSATGTTAAPREKPEPTDAPIRRDPTGPGPMAPRPAATM